MTDRGCDLLEADRYDRQDRAHEPRPAFYAGLRKPRELTHDTKVYRAYQRAEERLREQGINRSEKRLARALLLLARYGKADGPHYVLPKISQEVLAEMVGTTHSRVNFFMNKFRKLKSIEYNGGLKINSALLTLVLHD